MRRGRHTLAGQRQCVFVPAPRAQHTRAQRTCSRSVHKDFERSVRMHVAVLLHQLLQQRGAHAAELFAVGIGRARVWSQPQPRSQRRLL